MTAFEVPQCGQNPQKAGGIGFRVVVEVDEKISGVKLHKTRRI